MATKVYKKKVYKKTGYKKKAAANGGAKVKKMERQMASVLSFVKDLTPDAQHAILWGLPVNTMLFSDGEYAGQCYFRVPVTAAIPMQRPGIDPITKQVANPDDWRKGNKVTVNGISISIRFSYCVTIQMMGVCYPARRTVQNQPIPLGGSPPNQFMLGMPMNDKGTSTRLMKLEETNFLSQAGLKDGPYLTVKGPAGQWVLHNAEQSLFGARLAKGPGRPIGSATWRVDNNKPTYAGLTFKHEFHVDPGTTTADTKWDSHTVEVYFTLDKPVTYAAEMAEVLIAQDPIECLFGIRAVRSGGFGVKGSTGTECASIDGLVTDISYTCKL